MIIPESLEEAQSLQACVLGQVCRTNIVQGVDFQGQHYSFDQSDESNLFTAAQFASATGMGIHYHADGQLCSLLPAQDIIDLFVAQQANLMHHQTYYNQLRDYIYSLTTIDDVMNVEYGQELTGKWLENYQEVMKNSQAVIEAYLGRTIQNENS